MKFSFSFAYHIKTPDKGFASITERFRSQNWQRDKEDDYPREDINFDFINFAPKSQI